MRHILFGSCVATLLSISSAVHAQTATEDIKAKVERLSAPLLESRDSRLQSVATFDHQVTGVTVTPDGRIFVNFPRWTEDTPVSVAELMPDGATKPYPNEEWNAWRNARMSEVSPDDHFVCVQSVVADRRGSLWVVDPGAPNAEKTRERRPQGRRNRSEIERREADFSDGDGCSWPRKLPQRYPHRPRWKVRLPDRFRFARRVGCT